MNTDYNFSNTTKTPYINKLTEQTQVHFEGNEVTLQEMLDARERRAYLQNELTEKYNTTLISFCLNIPGPIKTNDIIIKAFEVGKTAIKEMLAKENLGIIKEEIEIHEKTGDELILAIDKSPAYIKEKTIEIEENHPLGRIFDIDIIDTDGKKLSRKAYRKCLICGEQAQICASRRTHTVEELQNKIYELIISNS